MIQDDFEFKDFLQQQDKIVEKFMTRLGLQQLKPRNEFFKKSQDPLSHQGLPSPNFLFGKSSASVMNISIEDIEFMSFDPNPELKKKSQKGVELPQMSAVQVKVTLYKRGSKSSEVD